VSTNPSSSAKQAQEALGVRLREIRKDAGLSGRVLAERTGQHFTRVSKIEHGVQPPTDQDIRDWCGACAAEEQIADLIASLRTLESAYLEFRRQSKAGMKRVLGAHTEELYRQTTLFRIYEHNVVPGLFQTADYCAAMLGFWVGFLETSNDLADAVDVRMRRQRLVSRAGKRFVVVLEEQALRTWFGDARTQLGQLGRLLTVMSLPRVSIGVIPMMVERAAVPSAGFWIFDEDLVALETPTASIEVTRPQEIELYARMFEHLQASAVYGQEARSIISRAIDEIRIRN